MQVRQPRQDNKPQPSLHQYLEHKVLEFRAEEEPSWHLLYIFLDEYAVIPTKDWDNPKSKRRAWLLPENPEDQPDLAQIVEAYGAV